MIIGNQTATVLFSNVNSQSNTPAIVGAVVGGVLGFGALLAAGGLFAKKQIDQSTRKKHLLAAYIWEALKLQGLDNFKTEKGQKYVDLIETQLIPELQNEGLYTDQTSDRELSELAEK